MINKTQLRAISGDAPDLILEILADFHTEQLGNWKNTSILSTDEIKSRAHQLAGSSGSLGLDSLSTAAREVESTPENSSLAEAILPLLEQSVQEAKSTLESWINP